MGWRVADRLYTASAHTHTHTQYVHGDVATRTTPAPSENAKPMTT